MASENNLTAVFTDIANAIRDKKGSVNTMKPINMADEINSIQVGDTNFKDLVERTITTIDDDTITKVGYNAFQNCNNLISVSLPQATSIGNYAFQECSKLTSINFPNATSIGDYAFYECSSLTSANFPLATSIGNYAFQKCSKLANINISSATSIGSSVFQYCSSLTTLILRANQVCTLSKTNTFSETPIATSSTEGFIYVPDNLVESYKTATNWSTYASKIKGLSELPTE